MKNSIENDINREPKNNIKSVKFCSFVKNLKGFFLKKKEKNSLIQKTKIMLTKVNFLQL